MPRRIAPPHPPTPRVARRRQTVAAGELADVAENHARNAEQSSREGRPGVARVLATDMRCTVEACHVHARAADTPRAWQHAARARSAEKRARIAAGMEPTTSERTT